MTEHLKQKTADCFADLLYKQFGAVAAINSVSDIRLRYFFIKKNYRVID